MIHLPEVTSHSITVTCVTISVVVLIRCWLKPTLRFPSATVISATVIFSILGPCPGPLVTSSCHQDPLAVQFRRLSWVWGPRQFPGLGSCLLGCALLVCLMFSSWGHWGLHMDSVDMLSTRVVTGILNSITWLRGTVRFSTGKCRCASFVHCLQEGTHTAAHT